MFSYVESRGGLYSKTVFFGLQYFLKEYLDQRITVADLCDARDFFKEHGEPFNFEGWAKVVAKTANFDGLPVRIRALPEGSVVPTHVPLVTIESTDPETFWLVSWLETALLRVWYPTTVATISWHIRQVIYDFLCRTSDDPDAEIDFKLHDFGSRGVSSQESAGIGGAAHLVNFKGSDTVVGVLTANRYYNDKMAGFSIPASEHSSITSWGRAHEGDAYANMIDRFGKPGAIFACVSDSYDIYDAVDRLWGTDLRERVIKSGATLVVRPDSGDPRTVVTEVLHRLESKFGSVINSQGFKVLNNVRVIQGDGINENSVQKILESVTDTGFSASNIAFGMGGALLQQLNRDTQKFAMKCSSVTVDGKERDVYKDPVTDSGKRSKAGRLDVIREFDQYKAVTLGQGQLHHPASEMVTVYDSGIKHQHDFHEIRARALLK